MLRIVFRENGKQTSDCSDVITVCLTLFFFSYAISVLFFISLLLFLRPLVRLFFSFSRLSAFVQWPHSFPRNTWQAGGGWRLSSLSFFCGFNIFSEAKYAWLGCHNTLSTMCLNSRNVQCSLWHLHTLELQITSYKSVTISSDVAQSDDRAINITSLRFQPRDHTGCHYMYTNGISNRAMKLNAVEEGERV